MGKCEEREEFVRAVLVCELPGACCGAAALLGICLVGTPPLADWVVCLDFCLVGAPAGCETSFWAGDFGSPRWERAAEASFMAGDRPLGGMVEVEVLGRLGSGGGLCEGGESRLWRVLFIRGVKALARCAFTAFAFCPFHDGMKGGAVTLIWGKEKPQHAIVLPT